MSVQMVDRDERQPPRPGQGLGGRDPDEQGADEAWSLRDTDAIDLAQLGARLLEGPPDRRQQQLQVVARGDLGDDAAVARVELGLRRDDIGEQPSVVGDERGRGLVTRRLDPEDHECPGAESALRSSWIAEISSAHRHPEMPS